MFLELAIWKSKINDQIGQNTADTKMLCLIVTISVRICSAGLIFPLTDVDDGIDVLIVEKFVATTAMMTMVNGDENSNEGEEDDDDELDGDGDKGGGNSYKSGGENAGDHFRPVCANEANSNHDPFTNNLISDINCCLGLITLLKELINAKVEMSQFVQRK
jgi:hypothetical protein